MQFKIVFATLLASCLTKVISAPSKLDSRAIPGAWYEDPHWHRRIAANHLAIASGNYSLIPRTWLPNVHLYQDRDPESIGSVQLNVTNSTDYLKYVEHFRTGFDPLTVHMQYMISSLFRIAIRWRIVSTVGPNFKEIAPQTTLELGDPVSYNGTDILLLDCETGLVAEVDSAFDIISYEWQLGYKAHGVVRGWYLLVAESESCRLA